MEHPVMAADTEMDAETSGLQTSVDNTSNQRKALSHITNDSEDDVDIDDADAEERALSAMSMFSHDSDDDPTWAPSESEKIKLHTKKAKNEKQEKRVNEQIRRKEANRKKLEVCYL